MNPEFQSPHGQLYECRDCPARCCRMPWSIALAPDEVRRIEANDWARARLAEYGASLVPGKGSGPVLPMREVERQLQCVFLDDDGLCGLHKRFGHESIPAVCQLFPFDFVRGEDGKIIAHLSHLCPSIRDNYGLPVGPKLAEKLAQAGGRVVEIADATPLGGTRFLSRSQTAAIARHWADALAGPLPLPQTLANLYDEIERLRASVPGGPAARGPIPDADFDAAWRAASADAKGDPIPLGSPPPPIATVLFALYFSPLAYPARVNLPHRVRMPGEHRASPLEFLSTVARLMFGKGEMDLLFIDRPVPLEKVTRVARFLPASAAAPVRAFLQAAVERRGLFRPDTDLFECLFTLALAASLISRFARSRAAAEGRREVESRDLREGISVAELVLLTHARLLSGSALTRLILRGLATNRLSFRNVLIAEA